MDKMESVIAYVYSADFIADHLPSHGPLQCGEATELIDCLEPIPTMPHFIFAPAACASAPTLAFIPTLMRASRYRHDRARLMRGYLRAMKDDAKRRLRQNAQAAACSGRWGRFYAGSAASLLVTGCFAFMQVCGFLYRLRLPVGFRLDHGGYGEAARRGRAARGTCRR